MKKSEMGLVDKMIYETYKDKVLGSSEKFKSEVKSNYNYKPSSDLYTMIINYQIKKYGKQLTNSLRDYQKNFHINKKMRDNHKDRILKKYYEVKELERLENEKER